MSTPDRNSASTTVRLGVWIYADEPLWVQVRIAAERTAHEQGVELVFLDGALTDMEVQAGSSLREDLRSLDLNGVLCNFLPKDILLSVLASGLPVIHLGETEIQHPRLFSLSGLYEVARSAGLYLSGQLVPGARVLAIGGGMPYPSSSGQSRLEGLQDGLARLQNVQVTHLPTDWTPTAAWQRIETEFARFSMMSVSIDAIFGLSDPLALLALEMARSTKLITPQTPVVGINGDPTALASILLGNLRATVDLDPDDLGQQVVGLARAFASGAAPAPFRPQARLITAANVGETSARKLIALAELPSRLVGVNRDLENQRTSRMEAHLELARRILRCRDESQLVRDIPEAIRFTYGYDQAQFYWNQEGVLQPAGQHGGQVDPDPDEPLGLAARGQTVFIADARRSELFAPDARFPEVRARVALPVAWGEVLGVLDLHGLSPARHHRQELSGLQWLAEQFGLALHQADPPPMEAKADPQHLASREMGAARSKTVPLASLSHAAGPPVLMVDGDFRARILYRETLARAMPGRLVHTLADGAEALKTLERETPGLLIIDLDLPKKSGIEVLTALRRRYGGHPIPILILSQRSLLPEYLPVLDSLRMVYQHKSTLAAGELAARLKYLESGTVLSLPASRIVKRAVAYIYNHYPRPFTLKELAAELEISANHLSHIFGREMGLAPWAYLHRVRISHAKILLRDLHSIQAVAAATGFEDGSYFARVFRRLVGLTPHEFRNTPPTVEVLSDWGR